MEAVEECRQALANRQKLNLLSDRSEFGWEMARKYELAADSDDEKKVRKAKKEAQKNAERSVASWRKETMGERGRHTTSESLQWQDMGQCGVSRRLGPVGISVSSGPGQSSRPIGVAPIGPYHFVGNSATGNMHHI